MLLFQHTITGNVFLKENVQKIIDILNDAIIENGVRVRILTSKDMHKQLDGLTEKQKSMTMPNEVKKQSEWVEQERGSIKVENQGKFDIHTIDAIQDQQQQSLQSKVSILIIDSKVSLIDEANTDNSKEGNNNNLALATYSNSESTLLAYISIFETL